LGVIVNQFICEQFQILALWQVGYVWFKLLQNFMSVPETDLLWDCSHITYTYSPECKKHNTVYPSVGLHVMTWETLHWFPWNFIL